MGKRPSNGNFGNDKSHKRREKKHRRKATTTADNLKARSVDDRGAIATPKRSSSAMPPPSHSNPKAPRELSLSLSSSQTESQPQPQPQPQPRTSTPRSSFLARLRRTRGTAETTPDPPLWVSSRKSKGKRKSFLTPDDGEDFESCLRRSYRGYHWEPSSSVPSSIRSSFSNVFDGLEQSGLFRYDVVQAGLTKWAKTLVTRTLVGAPGSTYKYLGLRLFSHPWCADNDGTASNDFGENDVASLRTIGYEEDTARSLVTMGQINSVLIERSRQLLEAHVKPMVPEGLVGSAEFNLTLVNRMDPTESKSDKFSGTHTSVGWHRDSGLQDFSTIAVYHELREQQSNSNPPAVGDTGNDNENNNEQPWRVALRVSPSTKQTTPTSPVTPPLAIPLPNQSLYYLLDDFNHRHEHAVVAPSPPQTLRYSSTHRVAREGRGWRYIQEQCFLVVNRASPFFLEEGASSTSKSKLLKEVTNQQRLMTELEFEWIRQWYVQGKVHHDLHPYWHRPIQTMIKAFCKIQSYEVKVLRALSSPLGTTDATQVQNEGLYDVMIEALEERAALRRVWAQRVQSPIFSSEKPMECRELGWFGSEGEEEEDLSDVVRRLRSQKANFVKSKIKLLSNGGNHKLLKTATLTKKERRKTASNWEAMKQKLQKNK